ncbi:MAG: hypothetical protein GWO08_15000, partial [Gammaproteobacteria bacterium]|nr:hypothetical protein [Gammaproteobacteria bacterium]NIR94917.1 hypothetical protein [Gammaproteobacteria bacterium]
DPGAGLLYDWGVADFAPDALGSVLPVAAIDGNASTTIGSEIELNGTGSHPGSGNQLSYFWHVVSAPNGGAVSPQDKTSATLHFNADLAGEYGVVLVVYDGEKYSDAAYFNVQVV